MCLQDGTFSSIVTKLQAGPTGVRLPAGVRDFSCLRRVQTPLGPTQPPVDWAPVAFSSGLKRLGCDCDHSPSSSAEVMNEGICIHSCNLHGVYRDNCAFASN